MVRGSGHQTLGPGWSIADWALGARERQVVVTASGHDGVMGISDVVGILRTAAERGHGWRDVEALLHAPRYKLGVLREASGRAELGLKRAFRQALTQRDPRYPTRLPWGMRVARIEGAQPGEHRRVSR